MNHFQIPQVDLANQNGAYTEAMEELISTGRMFFKQGWVFGTSGNFSARLSRKPFRLIITKRGAHKGTLSADDFLQVDERGESIETEHRPSAETSIHLAIISECDAGAVLHTHSVWATLLSDWHAKTGGITIQEYEMLKGLSGVQTHEHQEWVPILENSQDYGELSRSVSQVLKNRRNLHGILLRRHGLYTWGRDIAEARRHIEILEFLFEVLGRSAARHSS